MFLELSSFGNTFCRSVSNIIIIEVVMQQKGPPLYTGNSFMVRPDDGSKEFNQGGPTNFTSKIICKTLKLKL